MATENKVEIRLPTKLKKYWTGCGRGDKQGDVKKEDHHSYRRPYMYDEKCKGKEEEEKASMLALLFITSRDYYLESYWLVSHGGQCERVADTILVSLSMCLTTSSGCRLSSQANTITKIIAIKDMASGPP